MATLSPAPARLLSRFLRRLTALTGVVALAAAFADAPHFSQALAAVPESTGSSTRVHATLHPASAYRTPSTTGPAAFKPVPWAAAYNVVHERQGADINGDGTPDFVNPTGKAPRGQDAYGSGEFGASRTGHTHAGVDYVSQAGQQVLAPIAGFVTRVGYAYRDSAHYRYVEITNRMTGYTARVMYVGPEVREGQALALGQPIGHAQTLQTRYPSITDHVHLEIARLGGRQVDAAHLIPVSA
jgi:murein DD-endopeptidase MepM/ murein hydrolase activator NlpD